MPQHPMINAPHDQRRDGERRTLLDEMNYKRKQTEHLTYITTCVGITHNENNNVIFVGLSEIIQISLHSGPI